MVSNFLILILIPLVKTVGIESQFTYIIDIEYGRMDTMTLRSQLFKLDDIVEESQLFR